MIEAFIQSNSFCTFITNVAGVFSGPYTADTIFSGLMALFTGVGLFFAWRAWRISKTGQWREILTTYFKEYRTYEMGKAVSDLYSLLRKYDYSTKNLVFAYVDDYLRASRFHFNTRRRVSAFYQEIAVLCNKNNYVRRIVYSLWTKGDLEIIPTILLPIETIAIPLANRFYDLTKEQRMHFISERIKDNNLEYLNTWASVFKKMYKLWDKAPKLKGE